MVQKDENRLNLSSFIRSHWGIILTVISAMTFLVGHFFAFTYYRSWNIPYLKFADSMTPFAFLVEAPMSIVILVLLLSLGIFASYHFLVDLTNLERKKKEGSISKTERFLPYIKYTISIALIMSILLRSLYLYSTDKKKNALNERLYIPFVVTTNSGKESYRCVTPLGSIGSFYVLITEFHQPILVQKQKIESIMPLMGPFPLKEMLATSNPFYQEEKKEWDLAWDGLCKDGATDNQFLSFNFIRKNDLLKKILKDKANKLSLD